MQKKAVLADIQRHNFRKEADILAIFHVWSALGLTALISDSRLENVLILLLIWVQGVCEASQRISSVQGHVDDAH